MVSLDLDPEILGGVVQLVKVVLVQLRPQEGVAVHCGGRSSVKSFAEARKGGRTAGCQGVQVGEAFVGDGLSGLSELKVLPGELSVSIVLDGTSEAQMRRSSCTLASNASKSGYGGVESEQ